jgi:uncharacterized protein YecE (DUF72 family)
MKWYIGCSGFYYKHWKGVFYPDDVPQKRWLEYYNTHFETVEINNTFYRFPNVKFLNNLQGRSSEDFRFSVKVPRAITHFKQMHEAGDMLTDFYDTVKGGMGEKLGPVLFQFPGRFKYSDERLQRILNQLDPAFTNVVEFRDPSWWRSDVFEHLGEYGITFCGQSHPALPNEVVANGEVLYYRFHGVPDLYKSPYDDKFLKSVVEQVKAAKKVKQVWCYFNNDIDVAAVANAKTLMDLTNQSEK